MLLIIQIRINTKTYNILCQKRTYYIYMYIYIYICIRIIYVYTYLYLILSRINRTTMTLLLKVSRFFHDLQVNVK